MGRAQYGQGTTIKVRITFSDPDDTTPPLDPKTGNTLLDPTTVALLIKDPDGQTHPYTLLGGDIIRDSQGKFRFNLLLSELGTYTWRWTGTTALKSIVVFGQCDSYTEV